VLPTRFGSHRDVIDWGRVGILRAVCDQRSTGSRPSSAVEVSTLEGRKSIFLFSASVFRYVEDPGYPASRKLHVFVRHEHCLESVIPLPDSHGVYMLPLYRCGPPALACSFGQVVIFTAHARYLLWIIFSLYEKINLNDPHGGPPQLHTKLIWQGARAVLYNSEGS
jgi:hypothetical protein